MSDKNNNQNVTRLCRTIICDYIDENTIKISNVYDRISRSENRYNKHAKAIRIKNKTIQNLFERVEKLEKSIYN